MPDSTTLNRRRVLKLLWLLPFATGILQMLRMMTRYTMASTNTAQSAIIDLGPFTEVPEKLGEPLYHRRGRFWLLQNEDGLVAITNTCSHLDCLFDWDPATANFFCPCHGSRFDRSGRVINGPATRDLDRYPLQLISAEGVVLAETDDTAMNLVVPQAHVDKATPPSDTAVDIDREKEDNAAQPVPHLWINIAPKLP